MKLYYLIRKSTYDTLAPKGKFEQKRVASFTAFWVAVGLACYGFHYDIVLIFIGYSATAIGLNVWNKKIDKE
jgi:hypothetical protein